MVNSSNAPSRWPSRRWRRETALPFEVVLFSEQQQFVLRIQRDVGARIKDAESMASMPTMEHRILCAGRVA